MGEVTRDDEIQFIFLYLDMVPRNSTPGKFANIWQSKWGGIIAIKTEKTQIHFLSDILIAVASLDLKVANDKGDRPQGHPTTIFGKISIRKTIWDLISCLPASPRIF